MSRLEKLSWSCLEERWLSSRVCCIPLALAAALLTKTFPWPSYLRSRTNLMRILQISDGNERRANPMGCSRRLCTVDALWHRHCASQVSNDWNMNLRLMADIKGSLTDTTYPTVIFSSSNGSVLCSRDAPIPVTTHFAAQIVVFDVKIPVTVGFPVSVLMALFSLSR